MTTLQLGHTPRATIGAHADYRTSDFYFPRVQSLELRDVPWERRLKPINSWYRYSMHALVVLAAGAFTFALF